MRNLCTHKQVCLGPETESKRYFPGLFEDDLLFKDDLLLEDDLLVLFGGVLKDDGVRGDGEVNIGHAHCREDEHLGIGITGHKLHYQLLCHLVKLQ